MNKYLDSTKHSVGGMKMKLSYHIAGTLASLAAVAGVMIVATSKESVAGWVLIAVAMSAFLSAIHSIAQAHAEYLAELISDKEKVS